MFALNSSIIIIDTNGYYRHFEKQLCAYITGHYGECNIGMHVAKTASAEIQHFSWWRKNIHQEPDDSGCYRPVTPWETPGWFSLGHGQNYQDQNISDLQAKELSIQSFIESEKERQNSVETRLLNQDFDTTWTKEKCLKTQEQYSTKLDKSKHSELFKYPTHYSIAIFVDKLPQQDVLKEMISRIHYFAENDQQIYENSYELASLQIAQKNPVVEITNIRLIETAAIPQTKFPFKSL